MTTPVTTPTSGRLNHIGPHRGGPLHQQPLVTLLVGGAQPAAGARPQGADLVIDHSGGPHGPYGPHRRDMRGLRGLTGGTDTGTV